MSATADTLDFLRYHKRMYVAVDDLLAWMRKQALLAYSLDEDDAYVAIRALMRVIERDTP